MIRTKIRSTSSSIRKISENIKAVKTAVFFVNSINVNDLLPFYRQNLSLILTVP